MLQKDLIQHLHFLYMFHPPSAPFEPIIQINDLLLQNAQEEFESIRDQINRVESTAKRAFTFEEEYSKNEVLNHLILSEERLVITGPFIGSSRRPEDQVKEIHSYLSKSNSSVLLIPEKHSVSFPLKARMFTNLEQLDLSSILGSFPLELPEVKIHHTDQLSDQLSIIESVPSELIISAQQKTDIHQLRSIYTSCISHTHSPVLFINSEDS